MPTTPNPSTLQALTALGLTTTAFLSGQTAASTYMLLPSILLSPAPLLLHQWRTAYTTGHAVTLPSSLALSTLFAYLSYTFHTFPLSSARWRAKLFLIAAAMPLLETPWTVLLMNPINGELLSRAEKVDKEGGGVGALEGTPAARRMGFADMVATAVGGGEERERLSSHQLVDVWGWLNLGRAVVMLAGAGCAVWGVVGM